MNQSDPLPKTILLNALEQIDTRHPSEFYVSQEEQWDNSGASWAVRFGHESGEKSGRLLTDDQLRLVLLKALAYDDLIATLGLHQKGRDNA